MAMPSVKAIKKYNNYGYAKCEGYTCPGHYHASFIILRSLFSSSF